MTEITRSPHEWMSDIILAADDIWMAADSLGREITITADHDYDGKSRVRIEMKEAKNEADKKEI